jgi:hypothetical protein
MSREKNLLASNNKFEIEVTPIYGNWLACRSAEITCELYDKKLVTGVSFCIQNKTINIVSYATNDRSVYEDLNSLVFRNLEDKAYYGMDILLSLHSLHFEDDRYMPKFHFKNCKLESYDFSDLDKSQMSGILNITSNFLAESVEIIYPENEELDKVNAAQENSNEVSEVVESANMIEQKVEQEFIPVPTKQTSWDKIKTFFGNMF